MMYRKSVRESKEMPSRRGSSAKRKVAVIVPIIKEHRAKSALEPEKKPKGSGLNEATSMLTNKQRETLSRSFQLMKVESTRTGLSVFIRLFQEYPQYKNLWPQFKTIPDSSLMNTEELLKHANVFMGALESILASLEDEQKLTTLLRMIAKAHQRRGVHRFHVQNLLPMTLAALDLVVHALTPDVTEAWTALFNLIASQLEQFATNQTTDVS